MTGISAGRGGWHAAALSDVAEAVDSLITSSTAGTADVVIVVPPFASPDRPSLGPHIIANVAEERGFRACVLYANLAFARLIGPRLYRLLCHTPTEDLVGERLFRLAHSGCADGCAVPASWARLEAPELPDFGEAQSMAAAWTGAMAAALASLPARYIGFSSVFEQTLPSLALSAGVKRLDPSKCTLLGGANTDGPMGPGLAAFDASTDYIFVGEAEASFAAFLSAHAAGMPAMPRVIAGTMATDMEALPPPRYGDYFAQFAATVHADVCPGGLDNGQVRLPYESSRGCWWGEKHHCTFCGLNANGMKHRVKSPTKVAKEIAALSDAYGVPRILMVDNIMPHGYFGTLLPRLAGSERRLSLFYEQKANITLQRMALLKAAGIDSIQPGIESLSTALLKRMRKGSTARTNLDCLRFARSTGVDTVWNLLCDFPGDDEADYRGMLELMPLLHHLQPPSGLGGVSIDRFSPYHMDPEGFGITDVVALDAYRDVFPGADLHAVAYHFRGTYASAVRREPELHAALAAAVQEWIKAWSGDPQPILGVFPLDSGRTLVIDTRACATEVSRLIGQPEAKLLLHGAPSLSPLVSDLLNRGQLAEVDGHYLAIACAPYPWDLWEADTQATDREL